MKKVLLFLLFVSSVQAQVKLSIEIQNRNSDSIVIVNQTQSFRQVLRSKGSKFETTFTPKEATYYLEHGGEWILLFLRKDYDLAVLADGQKVLQTIRFEGKGAPENNFLAEYESEWRQFSKANAFYQTKRNYAGWRTAFEARLPAIEKQLKTLAPDPEFTKLIRKREAENDESYKEIFREIGVLKDVPTAIDRKGKPAPYFEYENEKGAKIKRSDFKGKYVFIDLWATWCKPCVTEFPSLQRLEERYAGKNIAFVSISLDKIELRAKWKKMLADKHLDGIQLIADKDFNSDFVKAFHVQAIPHFILVAPNGIVLEPQALYPSDENLVKQLDALLR